MSECQVIKYVLIFTDSSISTSFNKTKGSQIQSDEGTVVTELNYTPRHGLVWEIPDRAPDILNLGDREQ